MSITKAEQTHAAIGELLQDGMRLADAVRQIAAETGRSEAAVRASYYNWRAKLGPQGDRRHPSEARSVDDAIREARQLLEQALELVDAEVEAANAEMEAATARYETVKASAAARRSELEGKIAAL